MAGIYYNVMAHGVSMSAGVAKTVIQIGAPSDQRVRILKWMITIAGTAAVDTKVRTFVASTAGTGSAADTYILNGATETLQSDVYKVFTVEPGVSSTVDQIRLMGGYEKVYPLGQEPVILGGDKWCFEVTTVTSSTIDFTVTVEE